MRIYNISNHQFTQDQEKAFKAIAGSDAEIVDIKVGEIDPSLDMPEVEGLTRQMLAPVLADGPEGCIVHLMTDFSVTVCARDILEQAGVRMFFSTTRRNCVEAPDGSRTYKFEFVRLRQVTCRQ